MGSAKRIGIRALIWALPLFVPAAALAQVGIAGQVRDTTGAVLPGVTVEASSPSLIEKVRTVVTDGQGAYKLIDLTAGDYTVTFSLPGFTTVKREGLSLAGTFTATVNAEMRVGAVEETVTVSGATPVVDVQNVRQNRVITREVIDALPTGKTFQNFAAVIPGVSLTAISGRSAQDVGGSQSHAADVLSIHGGHPHDQQNMVDGIPQNSSNSIGYQGWYIDAGAMQEFNYILGGSPAEVQTGGVHVNFIPKEGGNHFLGGFFGAYTNSSFQSDNITDALRARGVGTVSQIQKNWDANPFFGGPIKKDTLWFFASARTWGQNTLPVDTYYDKTPGTLTYTPDLSRPGVDDNWVWTVSARPTWQMTPKNKFVGYATYEQRCRCHVGTTKLNPPDVVSKSAEPGTHFETMLWTSTISNRLLLEAGMSRFLQIQSGEPQPGSTPGLIAAVDLGTGQLYRAQGSYGTTQHGPVYNWKAALSYVTGSHAFKTGFNLQKNQRYASSRTNGDIVLQLLNGVPVSLQENATPNEQYAQLVMMGLFAQDQWTVKRLTLNAGVRYDYHNGSVPEQHLPPVQFVGARDFAAVPDVPNWKDVSPRLGVSYDLFGNGKTALKVLLNRYVNGELFAGYLTLAVNPVTTSVNSTTRTWNDLNHDFIPDCDLKNGAANSECGPISNTTFGQVVIRTRFDDDYRLGWGKRPYNWETMASVEHELLPQVSINFGYYRRSFGNFLANVNVATPAAAYDPFCITAPADSRLPGGGRNQLCGFYDLNTAKVPFGSVNNLITHSVAFGKQTEIYNGVDLTMNARLPRSVTVSGGVNVGRRATDRCDVVTNRLDVAFVLDIDIPPTSPLSGVPPAPGVLASRTQPFCDVKPPFQPQVKFQGTYPLPWWGVQTSATFQTIPSPEIDAIWTVTNAAILPSLGRNLSSGANGTVRVHLIPPGTAYEDRLYQTDVRASKILRLGRYRIQWNFDIYNLFNASSILARNNTYSPTSTSWGGVLQVLGGRLLKFGGQLDF